MAGPDPATHVFPASQRRGCPAQGRAWRRRRAAATAHCRSLRFGYHVV